MPGAFDIFGRNESAGLVEFFVPDQYIADKDPGPGRALELAAGRTGHASNHIVSCIPAVIVASPAKSRALHAGYRDLDCEGGPVVDIHESLGTSGGNRPAAQEKNLNAHQQTESLDSLH